MSLLFPIGTVFGQTPGTGAIAGVVRDPADRLVQDAEILVVNEATHSSRTVTTTGEGLYRVQVLQPGYYSVTVTSAGFAPHISQAIEVTVSETTSLNVSLTISTANTSVKVMNDAEVAELEKILADEGKTFTFYSYEGAGHAFFSTNRPSYRPEAANDGWEKIFEFFGRHLSA